MTIKTFSFDKKTKILIYGYGGIGKRLFHNLKDHGYQVDGFIDKNAKKKLKTPVDLILEPQELASEYLEYIIILTFQNILEQERVAQELVKKGLNKLVYLNANFDSDFAPCFRFYNDMVLRGNISDFSFPLATAKPKQQSSFYIRKEKEWVMVELPDTLVFSAKNDKSTVYDQVEGFILEEQNISALLEYTGLMELILFGKTAEYAGFEKYCELAPGKDRPLESFLHDRVLLIEMMQTQYERRGMAFFRESPVVAAWNPKGYFNLIDGHHRAAFLATLNQMIPVAISVSDYQLWCNSELAERCNVYIKEQEISRTHTPILHPLVLNMDSETENRGRRTMSALNRIFAREDVSAFQVLDMHSNLSYYSQGFSRMGVSNIVSVEKRNNWFRLADMLNLLLSTSNINMKNIDPLAFDTNDTYEIVILANDIGLNLDESGASERLLRKINSLSSKYFIWRSFIDVKQEKQFILQNSKFTTYRIVNIEMVQGKVYEVGLFSK